MGLRNTSKTPATGIKMGNKSKAVRACLANISRAQKKSLKATIEDISDSKDADYAPPNLDGHDDMEYYEGSEVSEDEEADIKDDAHLHQCIINGSGGSHRSRESKSKGKQMAKNLHWQLCMQPLMIFCKIEENCK